jgi:hypothetical protein
MMHNDPSWGFAFRKIAEPGKDGKLTPGEIIKRLTEKKDRTKSRLVDTAAVVTLHSSKILRHLLKHK